MEVLLGGLAEQLAKHIMVSCKQPENLFERWTYLSVNGNLSMLSYI